MAKTEEPIEGSAEEIVAAAEEAGLEAHDADEFKPAGAELVVAPGRDVYRVMDRHDEEQILDELQGRPVGEMVYSFSPSGGGKAVTDLSYGGVREVVRTLNREHFTAIQIDGDRPPMVDEFTEEGTAYYRVMVYAKDVATGQGQWGTAVEPKKMKLRNGSEKWDKFALTKALNKAQRNAMKACLPLKFVEVIKAQYLKDANKVRELLAGPGAEAVAELPPPLDTPEAKALQAKIRERYRELADMNRLALLPAKFNVLLTNVAHDLTRMQDMLEHVEGLIELEKTERAKREAGAG